METKDIISLKSKHSVKATADKLEKILKEKNITIYARIDQQAEAAKAGISLNDIEFFMFGNPAKGGLVMAENPLAALDLPLKVLIWADENKQTWVSYNDLHTLMHRFNITEQTAQQTSIEPLIALLLQD